MDSRNARCAAVLLSLALSVLAQKPVITAEQVQISAAHPPVLSAVGTTSETSTIYDQSESLWKRWSMKEVSAHRVLVLSTSKDGTNWQETDGECFGPCMTPGAWDANSISSPTVVFNPAADTDARRYVLTYAATRIACSGGIPATAIGIAYSADGRRFERGALVLGGDGTSYGEPRLAIADGQFELSFFRVKTGAGNVVEDAGLGIASSADGIKWNVHNDSPITVEVVGKTTANANLVQRLRQLVDAYSDCAM